MTIGVNDYPDGNCGCTNGADSFSGCGERQCTSFAMWRIRHDLGHPDMTCLGMARDWAANARAKGFAVDNTPNRGAIAQLMPGVQGAFWTGHVAVTLEVQGSNVLVEDYNWCNECCCYHQHTLAIHGINFLHIGTPAGSAPPPVPPTSPIPVYPPTPPPPIPDIPPDTLRGSLLGLALVGLGAGGFYWARKRGVGIDVTRRSGTPGGFGGSTLRVEHHGSAPSSAPPRRSPFEES